MISNAKFHTGVLVFIFIVLWSSGAVVTKLGLQDAGPFTFLSLRVLCAAAILTGVCFIAKAQWPFDRKRLFHVVVAGLLLQTTYSIGCFCALASHASPVLFAIVLGMQPLLTGAISYFAFQERVALSQCLGLVIGMGGLLVATIHDFSNDFLHWEGFLFLVMALLGMTVGTLYQKRTCNDIDPRAACAIQNGISLIPIFLLAWYGERLRVHWTWSFGFALMWLALVLSVFSFLIFYALLKKGNATKVSSLFYLMPPCTAIMDHLFFGNAINSVMVMSIITISIGIFLANHPIRFVAPAKVT